MKKIRISKRHREVLVTILNTYPRHSGVDKYERDFNKNLEELRLSVFEQLQESERK